MLEKTNDKGPLSRLRVLDLTQFLSGPFATQILGDLGAEVIKIEPQEGELTRHLAPHFIDEDSLYYLSCNRNKRSCALDLKNPKGRELAQQLALASDIVIENFRPGVAERLGLSYDALKKSKPSLIWCSISGFGQDGPYRNRPAYDMIVQAMSGGMSMTGDRDGNSVRSGIPLGDLSAGMYAVIGVLSAVEESRHTGKGRYIDVSMLDCQVAMLSYQAAYFLNSGQVPGRQGNGHDSIPTYRAFKAGDGVDVVITANTERMWQSLCKVLELDELGEDPRFKQNGDRLRNCNDLWPLLEAAFCKRPAEDWVARLLDAEIPAAAVNTLDRTFDDPQVLHRKMVMEMRSPGGKPARVAGNPVKFRDVEEMPATYPPTLGQDSQEILAEVLGLTSSEIRNLVDDGVVATGRKAKVS
jgi:crotonobetainyl-CoA:carnitine CoA-transferase CaiB-like acyl-CoA transferase